MAQENFPPPKALKGPETYLPGIGELQRTPVDSQGKIQLIEHYDQGNAYDQSNNSGIPIPIDPKNGTGHPYMRTDGYAATKERRVLIQTDDGGVEYLRGNTVYRFDDFVSPSNAPLEIKPLIDPNTRRVVILNSSLAVGHAPLINAHANVTDIYIAVEKVDAVTPADPARLHGATYAPEDPFARFDAHIERLQQAQAAYAAQQPPKEISTMEFDGHETFTETLWGQSWRHHDNTAEAGLTTNRLPEGANYKGTEVPRLVSKLARDSSGNLALGPDGKPYHSTVLKPAQPGQPARPPREAGRHIPLLTSESGVPIQPQPSPDDREEYGEYTSRKFFKNVGKIGVRGALKNVWGNSGHKKP